jgi:hypothetical protein
MRPAGGASSAAGEGQACRRVGAVDFAHQQRHRRSLRIEVSEPRGHALDFGEGRVGPLFQGGEQSCGSGRALLRR